jgi:hypothetical protein
MTSNAGIVCKGRISTRSPFLLGWYQDVLIFVVRYKDRLWRPLESRTSKTGTPRASNFILIRLPRGKGLDFIWGGEGQS